MADCREQCGPHPVAGLERLGLGRLRPQPIAVERGGREAGGGFEQRGRNLADVVSDDQAQIASDREGASGVSVDVAGFGDPHPPFADPFLQLGGDTEVVVQVLQNRGRGVVGAEHGAGEAEQRLGLSGALAGQRGPAGGHVDDAGHAHRDEDEQQERQQVAGLLDGQRVHRGSEEPVQAEAGGRGGEHRRSKSADHRDRDDGEQVDQQVVGEIEVALDQRQEQREQAQHDNADRDTEPATAAVDGRDEVREGRSARLAHHVGWRDHVLQCDPKTPRRRAGTQADRCGGHQHDRAERDRTMVCREDGVRRLAERDGGHPGDSGDRRGR